MFIYLILNWRQVLKTGSCRIEKWKWYNIPVLVARVILNLTRKRSKWTCGDRYNEKRYSFFFLRSIDVQWKITVKKNEGIKVFILLYCTRTQIAFLLTRRTYIGKLFELNIFAHFNNLRIILCRNIWSNGSICFIHLLFVSNVLFLWKSL